MGICNLCATGSEEINLFKRYENNHKELGPHERNGFISVIFLMLFLFVFNIYDLATGSLYETNVIPVAATPNREFQSCQKMQSMKENYLQIDATVTAIAGDQSYTPLEDNIVLTVVSKAGCEVNREPEEDEKKKDQECEKNLGNISMFNQNKPLKQTKNFILPTWGSKEKSGTGCSNDCSFKNNGICEDGGKEDIQTVHNNRCKFGTDCNDCGTRAPTCGHILDDEQKMESPRDQSWKEFKRQKESLVKKKNTCEFHTLFACADDTKYRGSNIISNARQHYQKPSKWYSATFHIETNTSKALVIRLCPTLAGENPVDQTGWSLVHVEHGTAYTEQSSGKVAGRCVDIVMGAGEMWAATFARHTNHIEEYGFGSEDDVLVNMESLSYLGPIAGVWDERENLAGTAVKGTGGENEERAHQIIYKQSRTLLVLRGPTDQRIETKMRLFSVLGGLGGMFTIIVGLVGVCVNVCAALRPKAGFPVMIEKEIEKGTKDESNNMKEHQEGQIEMQNNPLKNN